MYTVCIAAQRAQFSILLVVSYLAFAALPCSLTFTMREISPYIHCYTTVISARWSQRPGGFFAAGTLTPTGETITRRFLADATTPEGMAMTTTVEPAATQLHDTLGAVRDWQQTQVDDMTEKCNELMRQAQATNDPALRREALAQVFVLSELSIEHMKAIDVQRVEAYRATQAGQYKTAVTNLIKIGNLVRESGLPGLTDYVANIQTQVDALGSRMGKIEANVRGNTEDISFLQSRIDTLERRLNTVERGGKTPRNRSSDADPDAPTIKFKSLKDSSWSNRYADVKAWFKDRGIGPQPLHVKDAFARNKRYKPLHK